MSDAFSNKVPETRAAAIQASGGLALPAGLEKLGHPVKEAGNGIFVELPKDDFSHPRLDAIEAVVDWATGSDPQVRFKIELRGKLSASGSIVHWVPYWAEPADGPHLDNAPHNIVENIFEPFLHTASELFHKMNFKPGAALQLELFRPPARATTPHIDPRHTGDALISRGARISFTTEPGTRRFDHQFSDGNPELPVTPGTSKALTNHALLATHLLMYELSQGYQIGQTAPGVLLVGDSSLPFVHASDSNRSWLLECHCDEYYDADNADIFRKNYPDLQLTERVSARMGLNR